MASDNRRQLVNAWGHGQSCHASGGRGHVVGQAVVTKHSGHRGAHSTQTFIFSIDVLAATQPHALQHPLPRTSQVVVDGHVLFPGLLLCLPVAFDNTRSLHHF